ncbi:MULTISPECIES: hypothetical protein [Segatella]|nr:hypothetical protein [Segatella copri]
MKGIDSFVVRRCTVALVKMMKDTDYDYLQSLLELTANSLRK